MTEREVRANVQDELKLARQALTAAELLIGAALPADAASRAYYAAFHAARALLFSVGIDSRSHSALRSLVSRHFVQAGTIAAELSKELAQLEALRSASDYDSAFALGVAEIKPELEKARRFVAEAERVLKSEGWI